MSGTSTTRDVVLFSTADWQARYWTNKQHTAARLAARGYRVLYVETVGLRRPGLNTLDLNRAFARVKRGLEPIREVSKDIGVLSPLTIPFGHRHAIISKFNSFQLLSRIRGWLRRQRVTRPIVWTYHPYMLDVAEALDPAAIVYHSVDDLGAVPGVDRAGFDAAEAALLARADHVFVTSMALYERCSRLAAGRTHYFNNVADIEHFGAARSGAQLPLDLAAIPRPRLMYVGALSDFKLDLKMLVQIVEARPDWHIVFIGDEREGQHDLDIARMVQRPNAHFLGWRPYSDLPNYLRGADVALLPQQINDYTRSMFPMKFFEYLAAGIPVVATPLPALKELTSFHRVAKTPSEFIAAIQSVLDDPKSGVLPLDHSLLRNNSWDVRLDIMLRILDGQQPGSADIAP